MKCFVMFLYRAPVSIARLLLLACLIVSLRLPGSAQTATQPTGAGLAVSGQIAKAKIKRSESLSFWITLKNQGTLTLKSVKLVRFPESEYSLCIFDPGKGQCSPANAGSELLPSIDGGQSYTVWGELRPKSAHSGEKLAFVVGWSTAAGAQSLAALPLGENQVLDRWDYAWDSWLGPTMKTLAIPAVLAFLAFLLDRLAARRETRQRLAERSEEVTETRRATEQAVATETWKQMLPLSHKYAGNLYLPMSSAAEDAIDAFGEKDGHAAFFYILLLLKRIDQAKKTIGGLYFKSYAGEQLAQLCWRRFRSTFLGKDTDRFFQRMHQSAKLLGAIDDFDSFKSQYLDHPSSAATTQILAGFADFETKRLDPAIQVPAIQCLRGFFSILDYESNRPYEYWYQQKARLKTTADTLELLQKLALEKKIEEATEYFKDVKIITP